MPTAFSYTIMAYELKIHALLAPDITISLKKYNLLREKFSEHFITQDIFLVVLILVNRECLEFGHQPDGFEGMSPAKEGPHTSEALETS